LVRLRVTERASRERSLILAVGPLGRLKTRGLALLRDDVVRVARGRESGVRIEQIAKNFGVHPMMLQRWLGRAVVDEGAKLGRARIESVEVRELRKRDRFLEQGKEVLWKAVVYLSQAYLSGK